MEEVSSRYAPVYTWLWNTTITREGIKERLDGMKKNGIEAMYVLAEPKNFRPGLRNTALSPDYLSDEYLSLLAFAHQYADSIGMHTWLYNEGGFPSGMACGQVCKRDVRFGEKKLEKTKKVLKAGENFVSAENTLSAFAGDVRVCDGYTPESDCELTVYFWTNTAIGNDNPLNTDIGMLEVTQTFLELTHEKIAAALGDMIGNQVVYMFDDESQLRTYSTDLDKKFRARFGYDLGDYLPYIMNDKEPITRKQKQAKMDYERLCGDLVCENYFLTMKKWLNDHNMKSTGHLDRDHESYGYTILHYGNPMKMLRAFDVPGIDVIWGQIESPKGKEGDKSCPEGIEFFPRFASSAARQIGSKVCISESFAVYGGYLTHEDMRYILGFQAARGINHFNFMTSSYEHEGILPFQYRPNFVPPFLGTDMLHSINAYTKRLQFMMQENTPFIKTALYFPTNTINSGGKEAGIAIASFEEIGEMLESKGVSFDIIDEDFVLNCRVEGSKLKNDFVCYDYVFVPEGEFELPEVKEILKNTVEKIEPTVLCDTTNIMARRVDGPDAHYYFIFNENGEKKDFTVTFFEDKPCYEMDLLTGDIYRIHAKQKDEMSFVSGNLESGEGRVYFFSDVEIAAQEKKSFIKIGKLEDFSGYVSRIFKVGDRGAENHYPAPHSLPMATGNWDKRFSGEVSYLAKIDFDIPAKDVYLDLGDLLHYAKVYVDGEEKATVTMPPYFVKVSGVKRGSELKIAVTNTIAGACIDTDYFDKTPAAWVGKYQPKMNIYENQHADGGFGGKVILYCEKA